MKKSATVQADAAEAEVRKAPDGRGVARVFTTGGSQAVRLPRSSGSTPIA